MDNDLPDELDELFQKIAAMIEASHQTGSSLSHIKQALIKKFGGFDEKSVEVCPACIRSMTSGYCCSNQSKANGPNE